MALPIENLTALDAPENMQALHVVGTTFGKETVKSAHVPAGFALLRQP